MVLIRHDDNVSAREVEHLQSRAHEAGSCSVFTPWRFGSVGGMDAGYCFVIVKSTLTSSNEISPSVAS